MGWFSSSNKEKKDFSKDLALPQLPKLPDLPKSPQVEDEENSLPQLPSLPSNQFGERFSQNIIKEAVIGRKPEIEEEEERIDSSELISRIPKAQEVGERFIPRAMNDIRYVQGEIPEEFKEPIRKIKKNEPVFVRIDKFQDSLEIFEKAKKKLGDIEQLLKDTKKIKEEEERELEEWEKQIQEIKEQIQKVDQEVFSRVE